MNDHCAHILFPETHYPYPQPAEYCENEPVDGSEFCEYHQEDEE